MLYVFLSVCCSVIVSVIIKLAQQRKIDVQQLVLWNYPSTVLLTAVLLNPELAAINMRSLPYQFYLPLAILLPTLFIFIALAIKHSGIVKTDVAQRMSIFVPLLASYFIFHENLGGNKLFGIALGLVAVVCSISWSKRSSAGGKAGVSLYPLIVFLGMGVIDVLFKQVAQYKEVSYVTSMFVIFVMAMIVAFAVLIYKRAVSKSVLQLKSIFWGLLMGLFNFGNIYLYMKAHRAIPDNPSIVFITMNIGVIVLGSLVGMWVFREKLSKINQLGLFLAIISILLITYL